MKLFLALQILLSASSYGPFVSAATSIEDAVGSGCENHIEFSSLFSTDTGDECNSCKMCDGYDLSEIFNPKGRGVCVECVSADSSCKNFNVITSFSSPWSMKFLPCAATSMSSEYDPKSVFVHGSNDSVTWMELFKSDKTETLLKERSGTVEFILGDNDEDYNFYKITFTLKDGVTKMHLGHLGIVPALTKTCTADIYSAITGEVAQPFETSAPTHQPTSPPTAAPTDAPGFEMTDANIKTAVNLWISDLTNARATYGHVSAWDVSKVTSMYGLFKGKTTFNDDISGWNTSGVISMREMFEKASEFNQDISNWDTGRVTNMPSMFLGATLFNANLSTWNTSYVTAMNGMFLDAEAFNCNITSWNIKKVTTMNGMFYRASAFEQDLCWDVKGKITGNLFFESPGKVHYPCT